MESQAVYAKEWRPNIEESKSAWSKTSRLLAALTCFAMAFFMIYAFSLDTARMRVGISFATVVLFVSGIRLLVSHFTQPRQD